MDKLKNRIVTYWDSRSSDFARLHMRELRNDISQRWEREILANLPQGQPLTILDIGTGTGYFALLLSQHGYTVTGIDLTEKMILEARRTAKVISSPATFLIMDAENLTFEDSSFDAAICRNLTWTLPHPERAYREWLRVLKPNGLLLNFDADYGKVMMNASYQTETGRHSHEHVTDRQKDEVEKIKNSLPISGQDRPKWDVNILKQLGYQDIQVDTHLSSRIYLEQDEFYNPVPMFGIRARKGG